MPHAPSIVPSTAKLKTAKRKIEKLQGELQNHADPQTKAWFENYLKGAIAYYGLKTPQVRDLVHSWIAAEGIADLEIAVQVELCQALLLLPHAEEKFAGTLYLQEFLLRKLEAEAVLDIAEWAFGEGCFFDWSTADWFTARVLMPLLKRNRDTASRIQSWSGAESLWQRRASIVSLRAIVADQTALPMIGEVIDVLVGDEQRFIQTGIGWTISDLSKRFPLEAAEIVERHFDSLSQEVIDRHTKYLPEHKGYKARKRAQNKT